LQTFSYQHLPAKFFTTLSVPEKVVFLSKGRSPGFRIILLPTPSRLTPVALVGFVPGYGGVPAPDFHRLPF